MPDIAKMRQEYFGGEWNEKHEDLDDSNTCCSQSMAIWLIICNAILLILAIACFGVGIWMSTQPAFAFTAGSLGAGCIFLGIFLLLIGALGVCAACRKSKCGLGIYSVLLTIFVIGELAAMAVAIGAPGIAVNAMNSTWTTMPKSYKNFVGLFYGCCEANALEPDTAALIGTGGVTCSKEGEETSMAALCQVHGTVWKDEDSGLYTFPQYSQNLIPGDVAGRTFATACAAGSTVATITDPWKSPDLLIGEEATPGVCACQRAAAGGNNPVDLACRKLKGAIPKCEAPATALAPFAFAAGVTNAVVDANTVNVAAASCYAKFENWLASNMTGAIIVLVILFLYQLFNVGFACALWCGACKKKSGDDDVVGPSGI